VLRNCQNLWAGEFLATSDPAVSSSVADESGMTPEILTYIALATPFTACRRVFSRATSSGALSLRQRDCAASMSCRPRGYVLCSERGRIMTADNWMPAARIGSMECG
jgi:hypothetical protein